MELAKNIDENQKKLDNDKFRRLIINGKRGELEDFIRETNIDINMVFMDGMPPLHVAIQNDNLCIVKLLVEYDANVNSLNTIGDTPLNYIIYNHSVETTDDSMYKMFVFFIENGADVELRDTISGRTPLENAVVNERFIYFNKLAKSNVDISSRNGSGETVLHMIMHHRGREYLRILFGNFHDFDVLNKENKTAIQYAMQHKYLDMISIILDCGVKIDYRDATVKEFIRQMSPSQAQHSKINKLIYHLVKRYPNNIDDMFSSSPYNTFINYRNELNLMKSRNLYNFNLELPLELPSSDSSQDIFTTLTSNLNTRLSNYIFNNPDVDLLYSSKKSEICRRFPYFSHILYKKIELARSRTNLINIIICTAESWLTKKFLMIPREITSLIFRNCEVFTLNAFITRNQSHSI